MRVTRVKTQIVYVVFLACAARVAYADPRGSALAPRSDQIAHFHLTNGKFLLDRGEFLDANSEFAAALDQAETDSVRAESLAWLAQMASMFLDSPQDAIKLYSRIATDFKGSEYYPNSIFQIGMLKFQRGELQEAQDWLSRFVNEYPESPQVPTARFVLDEAIRLRMQHELPPTPPPPNVGKEILVRLSEGSDAVINSQSPIRVLGRPITAIGTAHFRVLGESLVLNGQDLGAGSVEVVSSEYLHFKSRRYRGSIVIDARRGHLLLVNRLSLEQYLYSVVGAEMPSDWPIEALKTQAVASRSYAAFQIIHSPNKPHYDVVDDTRDQAYRGVESESVSSRRAVDETAGTILTWNDRPILAAFTENNGGKSSESKQVFRVSYPYLQARDDPYSKTQPFGRWKRDLSARDIRDALVSFGFHVGVIDDIRISEFDGSGRAVTVEVISNQRILSLSARSEFRASINRLTEPRYAPENLPDTLFSLRRNGDVYSFDGGGWGHGVGMSQQGAKARAIDSQTFQSILSEYYPGAQRAQLQ